MTGSSISAGRPSGEHSGVRSGDDFGEEPMVNSPLVHPSAGPIPQSLENAIHSMNQILGIPQIMGAATGNVTVPTSQSRTEQCSR